mmetsp:Transcript_24870/g.78501  ORF Transcript_24870/g.78501 Transcript_24870/m.78501 type:complete len:225 (-) Transcript_24870:67-741(-)
MERFGAVRVEAELISALAESEQSRTCHRRKQLGRQGPAIEVVWMMKCSCMLPSVCLLHVRGEARIRKARGVAKRRRRQWRRRQTHGRLPGGSRRYEKGLMPAATAAPSGPNPRGGGAKVGRACTGRSTERVPHAVLKRAPRLLGVGAPHLLCAVSEPANRVRALAEAHERWAHRQARVAVGLLQLAFSRWRALRCSAAGHRLVLQLALRQGSTAGPGRVRIDAG